MRRSVIEALNPHPNAPICRSMHIAAVTMLPLAAAFVVATAAFFGWVCVSIAEQRHTDATEVRRPRHR